MFKFMARVLWGVVASALVWAIAPIILPVILSALYLYLFVNIGAFIIGGMIRRGIAFYQWMRRAVKFAVSL
jgi:hypothetical protein